MATNDKSELLTCLIMHKEKKKVLVEKNNSEITFWSIPKGHSFIFYELSLWSTFFLLTYDTQDSGRMGTELAM